MNITVSIVILTQNSMGVVNRLIDRLLPQLSDSCHELVILDSNSTDGTVEYFDNLPFAYKKVLHVPKGTFSHSHTRMWGAESSLGDVVVFFSDDVVPCSDNFLAELVAPVATGCASAAYGVSLIDPETGDPLRAYRYNGWYLKQPELVGPLRAGQWDALTPAERRMRCNFDDCAACYNKQVLREIRFPDIPYGEDIGIAKRLLTSGHSIALAKNAKFYHWHNVSYGYLLKRMCIDQILIRDLFGLVFVANMPKLLMVIFLQLCLYGVLGLTVPGISARRRIHWILYSVKYIFADNIGKYMGALEVQNVRRWNFLDTYLLRKKQVLYDEVMRISLKRD